MAGGESNLAAQFREDLTCSICLELFTRPKMLPCQHTFCQDCLRNVTEREMTLSFKCPVCRMKVRMTHPGVAGLPYNRLARSLCTRLRHHAALPGKSPSLPSAQIPTTPTSSDGAAKGTGHHYDNQRHEEQQHQRVIFGGGGTETGQFDGPVSVTVSDEGEIFATDLGNQRIQVFTLQGTPVRQFCTVVRDHEKMYPYDSAMDGEGNLWVVGTTGFADFAVQYNQQGRVLKKFDLQKTPWHRGVAVDTRRNHILGTQTTGDLNTLERHGKVLVFEPDGTLVRTVGEGGAWWNFLSRQPVMEYPHHVTMNGEGNILVSDSDTHCVYVYNEDGQFLFQFGGEGSGEGQLKCPQGICTDRAGNIIVADWGNDRVELFDKTGGFLKHVTTDLERPEAVTMATQEQVMVTGHDLEQETIGVIYSYS